MKSTIEAAPAKLNLFLDIESRREDGYHNIVSIMQSVGFSDIIKIDTAPSGGIRVVCDNPDIPGGEKNIAYRAAEIFTGMAGISPGIEISIEKNIPSPAGLGGGSSDAAAVLRGLNKIYGRCFSYDDLCRMGLMAGADVPFCIRGGCSRVTGIGGTLERLPVMPECFIVIGCAGGGVSTPGAYAMLDVAYGNFTSRSAGNGHYILEAAAAAGDIYGVCSSLYNIFESVVLPVHSEAAKIKAVFGAAGAAGTLMSGSGPAVYGIFPDRSSALAAHGQINRAGYSAYICTPVPEFDI